MARELLRLILTLLAALTLAALLLRCLGQSPLEALLAGLAPMATATGLGTALTKACPLILVGLATVLSFRARLYNIGGEGQMLVGALAAAALSLSLAGLPGLILLPLTVTAGTLAGALWGLVPGVLKARLGVNEVLSTVMLNQVALQFTQYLLRGPLLDPAEAAAGTHIPQSATLPMQVWLWRPIPQNLLHAGLLLALGLALLAALLLARSVLGFHLRVLGASREAAHYAGIPVATYVVGVMTVSGALGGLAGTLEVLGVHHRALEGMSGGYGFAGIVAALLGNLHPLGLVPAAVFFGGLLVGADEVQRTLQVPSALALVFQGLVVLLAMAGRDRGTER